MSSYEENLSGPTAQSGPLEEIRVHLDRRIVKRKRGQSRFANSSAPNSSEEKMIGLLSWVSSVRLQK